MTDGAGARCDVAVIECGTNPGGGVVTACRIARLVGGQMDGRLAGGDRAVVAAFTSARYDIGVVERYPKPCVGGVAVVTGGRGNNV